ncbi:hypothetical protein RISK_000540 [Rhodopirellula islandica]|uniref:Uncharacterized protein n=1 Tax=Rhodopirellula islandica TaxID=595434 RepID=A0A0J1BLW9_RHOIS|nr:hypothetical protein RISK_000540 [Rhodopirellula islandica]
MVDSLCGDWVGCKLEKRAADSAWSRRNWHSRSGREKALGCVVNELWPRETGPERDGETVLFAVSLV